MFTITWKNSSGGEMNSVTAPTMEEARNRFIFIFEDGLFDHGDTIEFQDSEEKEG